MRREEHSLTDSHIPQCRVIIECKELGVGDSGCSSQPPPLAASAVRSVDIRLICCPHQPLIPQILKKLRLNP